MTTTRREMKGQASPAAPEGAQQPPQQAQQAPAQTPQKQKVIEQLEDPALHPPPHQNKFGQLAASGSTDA
eukprot:scaffold58792_cov16-Tisochrysis_lutea.AAC.2